MIFKISKYHILFLFITYLLSTNVSAQKAKVENGKVFGRIYTGFYYNILGDITPQAGFDFSTGILGYTHQISPTVKATLLYDVTRTTNFGSITDSLGNPMQINYFEGSKYTAFLKMAQIDWQFHQLFTLSVGQLLNEQYLTVQDKWWGFRYVRVSMQEAYRYGMPADFGARLTFKQNNFKSSIGVVNGEGPFRHQDDESKFLISTNIEYKFLENALVKLYLSYEDGNSNIGTQNAKIISSFFVGYKNNSWMVGAEYNRIENHRFDENYDIWGTSLYASYRVNSKCKTFYRFDYGYFQTAVIENYDLNKMQKYAIVGLEYEPIKNFYTSINARIFDLSSGEHIPAIHCNFGIKF